MNLMNNLGPQTTEQLYGKVSSANQNTIRTRGDLERFLKRKEKEGWVKFEKGHWLNVQ